MSIEDHLARERVRHHAEEINRSRRERKTTTFARTASICILLMLLVAVLFPLVSGAKRENPTITETEEIIRTEEIPEIELRPATSFASVEAMQEYGEDAENEKIEAALLERAKVIENCIVTYYDPCVKCCGKENGITASGVLATPYVTCGVDPDVIPLGSDVILDYGDGELQYLRAYDTGVRGRHIDICVQSHQEALEPGVKSATVYWINEEE